MDVVREVDQYRLCCGSLLEAELEDGRVVLRCLSCGLRWSRKADGSLGQHEDAPSTHTERIARRE